MMRHLFDFFAYQKKSKVDTKLTPPPSEKHFTWDKKTVDIYGKPTSLEELLLRQQIARDGFLEELGVTEESMSPTPTPK